MFFVQCEVAFRLWVKLYMETGLSWKIPARSLDLLSARNFGFGKTLRLQCVSCHIIALDRN